MAAFIGFFLGDPLLIRDLSDAGSLLFAQVLIGLHAAYDPADRNTWATPSRLHQLLAQAGLSSPRALDALIARFTQIGFSERVAVPCDRRLRLVRPSARLIAIDRAYAAAMHGPLHLLFPERRYQPVLQQDPAAHLAIRRAGLWRLARMNTLLARNPVIVMFVTRDAGYLALLMAMHALAGHHDAAGGPASIIEAPTYAALAQRLGVSRSHVRKLFGDAAAAGLVTLAADGGRLTAITPALDEAFDRFLAEIEADRDAVAQAALG